MVWAGPDASAQSDGGRGIFPIIQTIYAPTPLSRFPQIGSVRSKRPSPQLLYLRLW